MKGHHDKRAKKSLRLIINPAQPFSPAGFDARRSQCVTELRPTIDRLCKRYAPEIVFAALLSECEDAALAFTL